MGRDKVLGLSLAILVIGFAGAFCYRNEEFVEHGLKLARAKILDEGIAQRPGPKPYVTESKSDSTPPAKPMITLGAIEAVEPAEPPRSGQRSRRGTLTVVPRGAPQPIDTSSSQSPSSQSPPIEQFVSAQKERSAPEAASTATDSGPTDRSAAIVDKPLELTIRPNSPAFAPPDSLLDDSMTWQHSPNGRDGCPAMTGRESERSDSSFLTGSTESSRPVTYSVRRGDTLSKIALHFLGDSNRYREIFEVNRDQLQNPNARLKVGMTLRIPADRPRTKRPASSAVSQSKSTRTNSSSPGTPRTRQVPARPVSRSRELPNRQPGEGSSPAKSSVEEPTEPIGTPRFVPVSKGPFWRNRGDSSSADPRSRDLSQRAPAIRSKSSASDKDVERKLDANPSDDASTTSSPKKDVDNSSMSSEGSEGM
ncbi:MAG TPA: LysM peptidoglycan-binding domain-containing protein [Planctomycetaceae bacterium]|jgi:LysM repeat protein|nr:LysM peptidoglycan-binding domain-containing protein [Planctomycetaceae bacterium]